MRWTVDRIEGNLAIIEAAGITFEVPIAALPDASEGAIYELQSVAPNGDAEARLMRLKARTQQGPGEFDL